MAQQSQGIQQLLSAEKKAAEVVADARKKKMKRLKQAKEEAFAEVQQYRSECEEKFRMKEANEIGNEDFQKVVVDDTNDRMNEMSEQVVANKELIIQRMIDLVNDITPELHENYRP